MPQLVFNPLTGKFDYIRNLSETIPLTDLSDVTITSAAQYDKLQYNGAAWVNTPNLTFAGDGEGGGKLTFYEDATAGGRDLELFHSSPSGGSVLMIRPTDATGNYHADFEMSPTGTPNYVCSRINFNRTDVIADPVNKEFMSFAARNDGDPAYWISSEFNGTGTARKIKFRMQDNNYEPWVWFDSLVIDTDGSVSILGDSLKLGLGAAGITDSYIQYNGSNLDLYAVGGFDFGAGNLTTTGGVESGDLTVTNSTSVFNVNFNELAGLGGILVPEIDMTVLNGAVSLGTIKNLLYIRAATGNPILYFSNAAASVLGSLTYDVTSEMFTFSKGIIVPVGSVSAPTITRVSDTNTGIWFSAADTLNITTGGTERFEIDSSEATFTVPVSATALKSSGDIYTTGSGDDLWLGNSTQGSASFQAYANGNVTAKGVATIGPTTGSVSEQLIVNSGETNDTVDLISFPQVYTSSGTFQLRTLGWNGADTAWDMGAGSTYTGKIGVTSIDSPGLSGNSGFLLYNSSAEFGVDFTVGQDGDNSNLIVKGNIKIDEDNKKLLLGVGEDVSLYFDGSDLIINSENVTASDEVHFTNFDAVDFGASNLTTTGNIITSGGNLEANDGTSNNRIISNIDGSSDPNIAFWVDGTEGGAFKMTSGSDLFFINRVNNNAANIVFRVKNANDALTIEGNNNATFLGNITTTGKLEAGSADIGDGTNQAQFASDGELTLAGTAKYKRYHHFEFNYAIVRANGKPTQVTRGIFSGFSLPVYNNDDEELFSCACTPYDWDGTTDPVLYLAGWLTGAEDVDDDFNLQVSIETYDPLSNDNIPTTTNNYTIETNITTGNNAQYDSYGVQFTLDASAIGLTAGQPLGIRIRRIAAAGTEIDNEFAIQGAVLIWTCNKLGQAT